MKPTIVLIAGGTASGKTTIAEAFAKSVGAALIGHDRYYKDVVDPRVHNYDHPDALDTARLVENLQDLVQGRAAALPVYDFKTHTRAAHTERLDPCGIVVVEGILVLADPDLRALADLLVYVECEDDLRLIRRIGRDRQQRGRSADDVVRQYLETVRPMHQAHVGPSRQHATLLLDGTAPIEESVRRLMAALHR